MTKSGPAICASRWGALCVQTGGVLLAMVIAGGPAGADGDDRYVAVAHAAYATAWMQIHQALALESVDENLALERWRRAEGFLSFALERDPGEPMIGRPLLACALRLGMTKRAVGLLQEFPAGAISAAADDGARLMNKLPDSEVVVNAFMLAVADQELSVQKRVLLLREGGDYALMKRHYIEALSFYDCAVELVPGEVELVERVMRLYTILTKLERALQIGRRFVETRESCKDEGSLVIAERLARLYGQVGRAAEGAEVFARLYRLEPDSARVCENYMVLLQGAGRAAEVSRVADEFLHRHESIRTRVVYSGLLAEGGDAVKASEILTAVLPRCGSVEPTPTFVVGTVMSVARKLVRAEEHKRAIALVILALDLPGDIMPPPLRDGVCVDLAGFYAGAGEPAQAREILDGVLQRRGDMVEAWTALAVLDWEAGDGEAATATLRRGLKMNPSGPAAVGLRTVLAQSVKRRGDVDEAAGLLRENLAEDATDAETCNNLGFLYAERGTNLDEALVLIETALKVEPQNAAYLDSLGWVKYRTALRDNDPAVLQAAIAALRGALEGEPGVAVVHDHAADVLYVLGQWEDAVKGWQVALELAGGKAEELPNLETVRKKIEAVREDLAKETTRSRPRPLVRPLKPPPEGP